MCRVGRSISISSRWEKNFFRESPGKDSASRFQWTLQLSDMWHVWGSSAPALDHRDWHCHLISIAFVFILPSNTLLWSEFLLLSIFTCSSAWLFESTNWKAQLKLELGLITKTVVRYIPCPSPVRLPPPPWLPSCHIVGEVSDKKIILLGSSDFLKLGVLAVLSPKNLAFSLVDLENVPRCSCQCGPGVLPMREFSWAASLSFLVNLVIKLLMWLLVATTLRRLCVTSAIFSLPSTPLYLLRNSP
jgi:hypothetical protein